jgi:hypothetical protein
MQMQQKELVSRLIDLEEHAKVYASEYLRLIDGQVTKSFHDGKALRLRSRVQNLMRQIALLRGHLHEWD